MAGNLSRQVDQSPIRVSSILLTFTRGGEHSLTEIAKLAGLPISTAHRLVIELANLRVLEGAAQQPMKGTLQRSEMCDDQIWTNVK